MKKKCCKRYKRKGKPCSSCPTMAKLSKSEIKQLLKKSKRRKAS